MTQILNLSHLSDEQLLEYHSLYKTMLDHSKRTQSIHDHGLDCKFAYHIVRLINEVEQILVNGDLDITQNREQLKSIRRGEWTEKDIRSWFEEKETALEKMYVESKLQNRPDESLIKELLLDCLEHHYGSLSKCVTIVDSSLLALKQIKEILDKNGI